MTQLSQTSFDNYTVSGDVAVILICAAIVILLKTSYVSRTRSLRIFMNVIVSLVLAAGVSIAYHAVVSLDDPSLFGWIYFLRIFYQAMVFDVFFLFTLYLTEISGMKRKQAKKTAIVSVSIMTVIIVFDVVRTLLGYGFRISEDGTVVHKTNLFVVGYLIYVVLIVFLLYKAKSFLFRRVMYGFYGMMFLSVALRVGQVATEQSSLTTMTFVFPVIAMLYLIHSNPYNVTLGSVDVHAMEDMVRLMYAGGEDFVISSLLLPEYDKEGSEIPDEIKAQVRKFSLDFFKSSVLFQIGPGHLVLIIPKRSNPDHRAGMDKMLENFYIQFGRFRKSYKIVIGESIDEIGEKNEYASLIRSIERDMEQNSVHRIVPADIERYNRAEYILGELYDIYKKRDANDPRILAYCQPVLNLKTSRFDSAEALMRLNLAKTGIVLPDEFIPIAEEHGYIHVLTEIILQKTCAELKALADEGYYIRRISVNVSVLELKDENFCGDLDRIIGDNSDRIAIELTESRSDEDFVIMKQKIEELHEKGVQFYLDDFGTGYSNMERIMELPFDIIKFDRSLVVASGASERSGRIVDNLAHMFEDMGYLVLYEGVESDGDVDRCREMSASYLQGFRYSRPVPIEQLKDFLPRSV